MTLGTSDIVLFLRRRNWPEFQKKKVRKRKMDEKIYDVNGVEISEEALEELTNGKGDDEDE